MSMQQVERPPSYLGGEDDSIKEPSTGDDMRSPQSDYAPSLDSLAAMATTTLAQQQQYLSPSHDVKSPLLHSQPPQSHTGIPLKPLTYPAVPSKVLGLRADSIKSGSAMSIDKERRDQSVSIEDPDDRMAAEALCGLGKVDSARVVSPRAPSGYETPLKYYPMNIEHTRSANGNGETEPLLSLLTSSHPWLGGTISGSMSAYSSTKQHSPRFIQNSAEFVERHIGTPVTHTINSVGKKTGVETSLRKYLGSKQQHHESDLIDPEILGEGTSNKRRRITSEQEDDGIGFPIQRTLSGNISVETLPVYDDNRSPAYEATDSTGMPKLRQRPTVPRSWSTQLMISTSGLGAALNEASLRSLKYVLAMLKSANKHVGDLMEALKKALQEYDAARVSSSPSRLEEGASNEKNTSSNSDQPPTSSTIIAQRIQHLNGEIWRTLKSVVTNVSKYTGGALPENASVIVRWQLMSVPHRWQRAVSAHAQPNEKNGNDASEALTSAHRMMAFGVEGIDMMQQVGGVVESTIESAERWLGSMGRKTEQSGAVVNEAAGSAGAVVEQQSEDINMGDSHGSADSNHSAQQAEQEKGSMLIDTTS